MAAEQKATPNVGLSQTDINWDRLDKTKFHVIGAVLFSAVSALLHPISVVKTRIQVAGSEFAHMNGLAVFRHILKADGISGLFRGFGTAVIGSLPGRVLFLTSLEVSKDSVLKATEDSEIPETTRVAIANGTAGLISSLVSEGYYVPLDVVCQRLMVQGLHGMTKYNGAVDAVFKISKTEGIRGLYRGFGMSVITYSPSTAVWWGAYGSAQHMIWRSLGYGDDQEKRSPQQWEMVLVQATAGTLAGAAASVLTTPLDTVKTRLQVMDNYGEGRPTIAKTVQQLLKEDGWKGFYRGFGPRFLNMSLWGTSMVVTYEIIKRLSVKDS
eukprot:Gb_30250 [translate_table: standard]